MRLTFLVCFSYVGSEIRRNVCSLVAVYFAGYRVYNWLLRAFKMFFLYVQMYRRHPPVRVYTVPNWRQLRDKQRMSIKKTKTIKLL